MNKKRNFYSEQTIDFVKENYGKLTSLKLSEELNLTHREVRYIISTHNIKSKRYSYQLSSDDRAYNVKYKAYRYAAEKKGRDFEISFDVFKEIIQKDCFYCGTPAPFFVPRARKSTTNKVKAHGIDRANSSLGYVAGNCLPCCSMCNTMKLDNNMNVFLNHVKVIYEFNFEEQLAESIRKKLKEKL